jgi:uncharacterized protein (TIGR03083 family)
VTDRSFIDQLDDVWASIASVCSDLTPEQWDTDTDCPGWTVRDQVAHIIGTESALLGRPAPPPASTGLAYVHNPIGEINEAWVQARRSRPGVEVLAEFEEVTAARRAAIRGMSDEELDTITGSPIGQVPYATFMDVRVMDCWVHEQDIRRAVGRPGHLDGPAADAAIRRFCGSLGFVVGKRAGAADGTTVVFELTGPLARTVAIGVRDGRAQVLPEVPDGPSVRMEMDAETFACLVAGRWTAERAKVAISGDDALGRKVVDSLATIP